MRVVVADTNIVISAVLSPFGNPAEIMNLIFDREVQVYYTSEIIDEYEEVLSRPHFKFDLEKRKMFIDGIKRAGIQIEHVASDVMLPDESDRVFYDTAKECGAILITGNIKHYPTESFIMTPTEYLRLRLKMKKE